MTVYAPVQVCRQQRFIRVISGGVDDHLAPAHSFLRFPCLGIVLIPRPSALGAAVDLSAFTKGEVRAVFTPFNVRHVGNGRGKSGWLVLVSASGGGLSTPELRIRREPLVWILLGPGPAALVAVRDARAVTLFLFCVCAPRELTLGNIQGIASAQDSSGQHSCEIE